MQPNDQRHHTPYIPPRDDTRARVPNRDSHDSQEAAANIVRGQIDSILKNHDPVGDGNAQPTPVQTPQAPQHQTTPVAPEQRQEAVTPENTGPNPYHHTHTVSDSIGKQHNEQWEKYHSAWQRYYQEYYSRYYVGELYKTQADLAARQSRTAEQARQADASRDATMSQSEAIGDLRTRLRKQITDGAKKARGSKHFIPIASAAVVMLIFVFLQFNSIIFAAVYAYKSPGNIEPANVLTNPSTSVVVSDKPVLIVPKLNIDVPVDYSATPDYDSQMTAMKNGVAYFGIPGANAKPGQIGNFGIAGHSSNQLFDTGAHKFIFVNLDLLQKGDLIYLNYQGTRYTYSVTHKLVVDPDDVAALQDNTTKPEVTLITCTPAGTALHRLLVFAEQVNPSPSTAKKSPKSTDTSSEKNITMPGNGKTIFEKVFN